MTNLDQKILTQAIGECRHSNYISADGKCYDCGKKISACDIFISRRTFDSADDWNVVRVFLINNYHEAFSEYIRARYSIFDWIGMAPEQCCQEAAVFTKVHPDLFPWVVEMMEDALDSDIDESSDAVTGCGDK